MEILADAGVSTQFDKARVDECGNLPANGVAGLQRMT